MRQVSHGHGKTSDCWSSPRNLQIAWVLQGKATVFWMVVSKTGGTAGQNRHVFCKQKSYRVYEILTDIVSFCVWPSNMQLHTKIWNPVDCLCSQTRGTDGLMDKFCAWRVVVFLSCNKRQIKGACLQPAEICTTSPIICCRWKCWQILAVMCRWRPQWPSPPPSRPWYPPWASKVVTLLSQPPLPIALTPPWPRPLLVACSLPPFNFSSASYRPTWRVPHHFLLSQSLSAPAWPACFTHFVLLDWMVVMVVRLSVIIATFFLLFLSLSRSGLVLCHRGSSLLWVCS